MNKLNLLSKLAITGVVATVPAVGSMFIASSAHAQMVPGEVVCLTVPNSGPIGSPVDPCSIDGKSVRGLSLGDATVGDLFGNGPATNIEFEFEATGFDHIFSGVYRDATDPVFEVAPMDYDVQYAITIDDDPNSFFSTVEIDSLTAGSGVEITKQIFADSDRTNLLDTIISTDGGIDNSINLLGQRLQTLYITDNIVATGESALESYDNAFNQVVIDPSMDVPEPGTILGLLAVGGLGLGLKGKKQS